VWRKPETNRPNVLDLTFQQAFIKSTDEFYESAEFTAKEKETESFLAPLPHYLDGRNVSLENMVRHLGVMCGLLLTCYPSSVEHLRLHERATYPQQLLRPLAS
jgi:hypothetical protein